ncbi:MAG: hypothetical protein K0R78_3705 [Pelosinus sp.]|jgi:hypothetical protein|nr:hypothetical protein [Pelosinus sp.]
MSNRQHLSGIKLKSKTFRLFFIATIFLFLAISSTVSAESSDGYYNNGLNYEQTAKPLDEAIAKNYFRFMSLASTDKSNYFLDTATLTVTKDDNNRVCYETWVIAENRQEIQELNILKNQYEPSKRTIYRVIFVITAEAKTAQILSSTSYTQNGGIINTYAPLEPKIYDMNNQTLIDVWCTKIEEYILKMHIKPITVPNDKYLSVNEREFFDLFEARGYKINKIDEVQKYNPFNRSNYTASTSPYSFHDKNIEKEIHLYVAGDEKDHLKMAHMQFALEGPNYKQEPKKFNLPSKEKLNLFYMMLQALFPDWPKEESRKWIDTSIATMNQKNTLMFIYLHKGKEYIMISRQPVQGDAVVQYVLEVSQKQPGIVNPFYPYNERNRTISVYEEWDTLQHSK